MDPCSSAQSTISLQASDELVRTDEPRNAEEFSDAKHLGLHASIAIDDSLHRSFVDLSISHLFEENLVIVRVVKQIKEDILLTGLNLLCPVVSAGLIDGPVGSEIQSQCQVKLNVRVYAGARSRISYGLLMLNLGHQTIELVLEDH